MRNGENNMGRWSNDFYVVNIKELPESVLTKIQLFSEKVCMETYDRFSYDFERRVETIKIGKIAEEVFAKFMNDEYGITLTINYEIYEGTSNVDEDDFEINGYQIDIKSSKDTYEEGIESCYNRFNFPVPYDQGIKDLTISILYTHDLSNYVISSAIFKEDYLRKSRIGSLPVGNGVFKNFYLCKLTNGIKVRNAIEYILKFPKK
jgi:hypothetical protein